MENSVYYVASPEACAAILWKSRDQAGTATEALKITANDLIEMGVMDEVVPEPLGGAHRNPMGSFPYIKEALMNVYKYALLFTVHFVFKFLVFGCPSVLVDFYYLIDRQEPLGGAHCNPMGSFPYNKEALMNVYKCASLHSPCLLQFCMHVCSNACVH